MCEHCGRILVSDEIVESASSGRMTLYAFTDGASRGNPGESGHRSHRQRRSADEVLFSLNGYIGTDDQQCRRVHGPPDAAASGSRAVRCTRLVVHSDSELMVRQVNGQYKVKDRELRKYYERGRRCDRQPAVRRGAEAHPAGRKPGGGPAGQPGDRRQNGAHAPGPLSGRATLSVFIIH